MAVQFGGKREVEARTVDLVSPTGAKITVGAKRAEKLLEREGITMPDGEKRSYQRAEDVDTESAAKPAQSGRTERTATSTGVKNATNSDRGN